MIFLHGKVLNYDEIPDGLMVVEEDPKLMDRIRCFFGHDQDSRLGRCSCSFHLEVQDGWWKIKPLA
jgi:hypothetical protein